MFKMIQQVHHLKEREEKDTLTWIAFIVSLRAVAALI